MRKKCIHAKKPKRGPYPMPMRPRVDYQFSSPEARENALLRHAWYRKQKFYDALREKLGQNAA